MIKLTKVIRICAIVCGSFLLVHCASKPTPGVVPQAVVESVSPGIMTQSQQVMFRAALNDLGKENYKRAIKQLTQLGKQGNFGSVTANLALAYYKNSQFEDAQTSIARALSIDPDNAKTYNLSGLTLMQTGNFPGAERAFLKALELDNNYALAHYNIALLYDIYYQEITKAYNHYLRYLALVEYTDEETMTWVEQLKYSVEQE